jgi:hypothetical protein
VLEPVVEDVDAAAEARLHHRPHDVAPRADRHDDALQRSSQHDRLVARQRRVGQERVAVAHDQGLAAESAPVSSAQDGDP